MTLALALFMQTHSEAETGISLCLPLFKNVNCPANFPNCFIGQKYSTSPFLNQPLAKEAELAWQA
jgi:hypothetical protein